MDRGIPVGKGTTRCRGALARLLDRPRLVHGFALNVRAFLVQSYAKVETSHKPANLGNDGFECL